MICRREPAVYTGMNGVAVDKVLSRALSSSRSFASEELESFLKSADRGVWREVYSAARAVRKKCGRDRVLLRALVETSNFCAKDCRYCGIRRSNREIARYRIPLDEIGEIVSGIRTEGYDAVAFQGGEIESEENTAYYEQALQMCSGLEVTLSLGEQEKDVYSRWKKAGALRYLLRIESSNRKIFADLHPPGHSFDRRVGCIRALKRTGYITGTGIMTCLPEQRPADLAADIAFFASVEADMVGMGPWIPHPAAPLTASGDYSAERAVELTCRMIALTRLYLHDVNIVSATALEALAGSEGRERGIEAGANVVMPNFTPSAYRSNYDLYPGKAGCGR